MISGDERRDCKPVTGGRISTIPRRRLPDVLDPAGAIATDIPCHACSYNLRGLTLDHRCPECGSPVSVSIQGNFLRFADPDWLDTLARGNRRVVLGIALVPGLVLFLFAGVAVISSGALSISRNTAYIILETFALIGGLAAIGLLIVGLWSLTTPELVGEGLRVAARSRAAARVTLIALPICLVADGLVDWCAAVLPARVPETSNLLILVALTIGILAYLRYMRTLAERIPDPDLVKRTRALYTQSKWLFILLIARQALFVCFPMPAAPAGTVESPRDRAGDPARISYRAHHRSRLDHRPAGLDVAARAWRSISSTGRARPRDLGFSTGRGSRDNSRRSNRHTRPSMISGDD
jgi:hypothetical protein